MLPLLTQPAFESLLQQCFQPRRLRDALKLNELETLLSVFERPAAPRIQPLQSILGSYALTFYKDGVSLGIAFDGVDEVEEPLYPIICSTSAKTEMTLGVMKRELQ